MVLTIKEIMNLAIANNVVFYEYTLYLVAVSLGEVLTIRELQAEAISQGLDLRTYITYKWQIQL